MGRGYLRNEVPGDTEWLAVVAESFESHEHAALVTDKGLDPTAQAIERCGERGDAGEDARLDEPCQGPND